MEDNNLHNIVNKKITYKDIEELLRCPICLEDPQRGVFHQCKNGHTICQICYEGLLQNPNQGEDYNALRKTVVTCPICRERITMRNKIAETLMTHMFQHTPIQCKYAAEGCRHLKQESDTDEHEDYRCTYRPQTCPGSQIGKCSFKGPAKKLIQHLKDAKCTSLKHIPTDTFRRYGYTDISTVDISDDYSHLIWNEGTQFLEPKILWTEPHEDDESTNLIVYLSIQHTEGGDWHITPRAIGPKRIQQKYYAEVIIQGKTHKENKATKVEHIYRGPLADNDDRPHMNIMNASTMVITNENTEIIENLPQFFDYSFRIARTIND